MSYPHYDCVTRAHEELKHEGLIAPRNNQDAVEQDKGLLTRRAAYYANQRDPTHGLLAKTSGNNSMGYSVDWILRSSDGEGWDVVTDDGTQALPLNGGPVGADPSRIPDWRQPTQELAQISSTPPPEPTPIPPADNTEVLNAIAASQAALMAHGDANTKVIQDNLYRLEEEVEEAAAQLAKIYIWWRRRADDEVEA